MAAFEVGHLHVADEFDAVGEGLLEGLAGDGAVVHVGQQPQRRAAHGFDDVQALAHGVTGRPLDVVVVGAGLGGLSAAAHLSRLGHTVTVVERDAIPGGRAGMIEEAGFRLDNGPTVLTMPGLLADAFAAAGADMADFVDIRPVDPMYRACYADGSTLHVRHGREAMAQEIREFSNGHEAEAFLRFCDWLEQLYRVEMTHFIDANFDSVLDLVKPWKRRPASS